jgi:hypothetical protein
VEGVAYFIRVGGSSSFGLSGSGSFGKFGLSVTEFIASANDDCNGALSLNLDDVVSGSTENATASIGGSYSCGTSQSVPG